MAVLLIVEDDQKTSGAICEYLAAASHKILATYDSDETLQIFKKDSIDLIILDIMLPQISGRKIEVSPKEIDLLRLLVEHRGLVLTRTQILGPP